MTYAELVTLRGALEDALTSGAGAASVQIGDRQITYAGITDVRRALAQVNRDIAAYDNRAANRNPHISTPRWR